MKVRTSLGLLALLVSTTAAAQDPAPTGPGDTVGVGISHSPLFTKRDAWIAGGFVDADCFAFDNCWRSASFCFAISFR